MFSEKVRVRAILNKKLIAVFLKKKKNRELVFWDLGHSPRINGTDNKYAISLAL